MNPMPTATRLVRRLPFPYRAAPVPRGVEPPPTARALGGRFETDWARRYPARLARLALLEAVVRPATAALAAPTRSGTDRLNCGASVRPRRTMTGAPGTYNQRPDRLRRNMSW